MNPFNNALDEFITTKLGVEYSKDGFLYHYTGLCDVEKIKNEWKCRHIREYQNLGEILPGYKYLCSQLPTYAVELNEIGDDIQKGLNHLPIHIFSMCREKGDRQMIAHAIESHGSDACAMISIDEKMLYSIVREMMKCDVSDGEHFTTGHYLLPCLYLSRLEDLDKIKLLTDFVFTEYLSGLVGDIRVNIRKERLVHDLLLLVSSMIKGVDAQGSDLSYEKEVRMIIIGGDAASEMVPYGFNASINDVFKQVEIMNISPNDLSRGVAP